MIDKIEKKGYNYEHNFFFGIDMEHLTLLKTKNISRILFGIFSLFVLFTQTGCGNVTSTLAVRKAPVQWVKNDTKDGWLAYSPKGDMQMIYYKEKSTNDNLEKVELDLIKKLNNSCGEEAKEKKCGVTSSSTFQISGDEYKKVIFQDPSFEGETQVALTLRASELEIFELSGKDAQVKTPLIEDIIPSP